MSCDIDMRYQRVSKAYKRDNILSVLLDDESDLIECKWEDIDSKFSDERSNYYWFGRMSGVRGFGPVIGTDGYPADQSNNFHSEYDGYHHSHSHVYLQRLVDEKWTKEDRISFFIYEEIPLMMSYCDSNNLQYNEFRILMCYD